MIWWSGLLYILVGIFCIELCLAVVIHRLKREFQWLVSDKDICPEFKPEVVDAHFDRGFDAELGWVRRPNTQGTDKLVSGTVAFHIDQTGARRNPNFEDMPAEAAAFGDSFTFCRLVEDSKTWPHYLSESLVANVLNFGVGNYGLDQAILRLERELPGLDSQIIIMGIVPETMARVQSYWKHFFEYGNILAFKPMFKLEDNELKLYPPAVRTRDQYFTVSEKLAEIKSHDRFFRDKFQRDILQFPYVVRLFFNWRRNSTILWHLVLGLLKGDLKARKRQAFKSVIRDNARVSAKLYSEEKSRVLLRAIVQRFADTCLGAGRIPVLLIIPQPVDLERIDAGHDDYGPVFESFRDIVQIVDMSKAFTDFPNRDRLYVGGALGPHPSPEANKLIAETLGSILNPLLTKS